jgi:tRNA(fMet)-specific endonuclease VapC
MSISTIDRCLVDTNALAALSRGNTDLIDLLDRAREVFVSSIILGELYYGAANSQRIQDNLRFAFKIEIAYPILDCDVRTGRIYGYLSARLKAKGRRISPNDVWIAATALQYDLTLITRDKDFQYVDRLKTLAW